VRDEMRGGTPLAYRVEGKAKAEGRRDRNGRKGRGIEGKGKWKE